MKKIFSLVLSALMLVTCFSFSASAEVPEGNSMALTIGAIEADLGATVTVPVKIETTETAVIGSMGVKVKYDTSVLEYVSETHQQPTGAAMAMANATGGVYTYSAIGGGTNFAFTSDVLFEMTFKVISTAAGDYTPFEFTQAEYGGLLATDGKKSDVYTDAGSLKINAPKYDVTFSTAYGTAPEAMTDVEVGTEITLEALENTETHRFAGWSDGEATYTDKYTVNSDVTLTAVWNEIVKYTVTYSEGVEADVVIAGESVTLPALSDTEDLTFLGWIAEGSDEVLAGGSEYTPTASVTLTAKWAGTKVYVSAESGNDENNGLKYDTAVKTLEAANALLAANADLNTVVIVGAYKVNAKETNLGISTKKITVTGYDETSLLNLNWKDKNNGFNSDDALKLLGDVEFKNIKLSGDNNDGRIETNGHKVTFGEGISYEAAESTSRQPKIAVITSSNDALIDIQSGTYTNVYPGMLSNGTFKGVSTVKVSGDTELANISIGHGRRQVQHFIGILNVEINGGKITSAMGVKSTGSNSNNLAANGYRGLRYFTINDGTVAKISTTDSPVYGTVGDDPATEDVKETNAKIYHPVSAQKGVTVFEINKAGVVTGDIAPATNLETGEVANDNAARVVIYNNGSYVADQVTDTGAYVLNVKNGKLSAAVNEWDGTSDIGAWAETVQLSGFDYTLPESGEYNAVKVGDNIYRLNELNGGLIPVPAEAGTYEVEFINAYKVTIGEETTLIPEGEAIDLTRLPQNGELKHIGWATTENAETAEIDHTTEYAPTADVTLYPVWAEAVYFTATFVTNHGETPEPISVIDDDEDGIADAPFTFPGYEGKQDEHFTFAGWYDQKYIGAPEDIEVPVYNAGDTLVLEANKTFLAKWDEDPKATVTYADTATTAPEAVTDYVGTEITIAAPGTVEGFEFLGWTDGTNVYQAGDKLTIAADVTLTAKWGVKVAVDANGAKGTAPVIGGEIGEEIDLPTAVELTKVNNTFKGFALSADGEIITGKYTVNPDDTLYVIWEETVADAAIIETKVVYNSATNDYTADMYFYGKDANTVAFGYTYGENLTFVSFAPAAGLEAVPTDLEVKQDGYYAYAVADQIDGVIEGAAASAGNGVHLGTLTFTYELTKDGYAEDDAADNIAITAPKAAVELVSSTEYFLYVPAIRDLNVEGLPVVFDEAIEIEIVDVVYTVNGSVKVVRDDMTKDEDGNDIPASPRNYAEIAVLNAQGNTVKTFVIEDENTVTEDGVFTYEIGLAAGEYTLVISKTGYLDAKVPLVIEVQEGAGEEGFIPTPVAVGLTTLVAGDVVEDKGIIDLLDFAGITSAFDRGDLTAEQTIALDIDEDGAVTVFDLAWIKANFNAKAE